MTDDETTAKRELPVVAIGASAGGVHAFQPLFADLPSDTGAAFVIIQHMAPDAPSQLPDIIARQTQMPVQTVDAQTRMCANTVYITPPDRRLATRDGVIFPAEPDGNHGHNAPIDHFFRSLADSHGLLAVGVVLSGTGDDGTLGIKAIKAAGGLTLAQQPDSAEFPGMPQSAVTTHVIDHVVELDRIGAILKQYFSQMPQRPGSSPDVNDAQLVETRPDSDTSIDRQAQDLMLREYVVPSVLVNRSGDILCAYGATGHYLTLPTGQARMGLLQMAAEDIRYKLRAAFSKAWREDERVQVTVMREHAEDNPRALCITIRPLQRPRALRDLCLVTFEPGPGHDVEAAAQTNEATSAERHLAEELSNTQADLQETIEELETSKEELQSANEELSTVNTELNDKINELERANDDMANLFTGLDTGVLFLDSGLCIKRFTPAIKPLINLIESDLGRPLRDIQLRFEDANLLTEADAVLRDLKLREAEVVTEEGYRYLRRIMAYRTANDHIEGVLITFTDITELGKALASARQSDEQLRLLADALPVLIAFVDHDRRFRFATSASATWLGLTPEALHGTRVDEALGPAYDKHIRSHVESALAGHQVTFDTEFERRDFGKRHVNIIFVPEASDNHANLRGFHVLVTDITQHKRREAERVAEQMEFSRTSRNISLNEMASMIAHQINQPLGAISSYTGALRRQLANAGEQPQELVDKIGTQAQAAADIIRDLRSFIGDRAIGDDPMDINALVRRVLTLTETRVEEAGVTVQLDLAAGLAQPRGSRVQIEQVLLNLIGNALEAMSSSQPARLTLATHHVDAHLEIRVHDTGGGIDQAQLSQLFEPFFSTKERSLGMGLAICRTIVEDHGGMLWAESSENGSVFIVRLPEGGDSA